MAPQPRRNWHDGRSNFEQVELTAGRRSCHRPFQRLVDGNRTGVAIRIIQGVALDVERDRRLEGIPVKRSGVFGKPLHHAFRYNREMTMGST